MNLELFPDEYVLKGHTACPGCCSILAMRCALKALGSKTIVILPACCWTNIAGFFPYTSLRVPILHTAFETGAACASGVRAALNRKGVKDVNVLVWAGDGGTFDIGLQALSGAVERNEDFIYVCYDNEGYMNTGVQRSSATPEGAWTTTTPRFKEHGKKNIVEIMVEHKIPYTATASVAYLEDFFTKMEKAREIEGSRFLHVLSPCPPGWGFSPEMGIHISRMAVQTKVFPIYEVEGGTRYRITVQPEGRPVKSYLQMQGRFRNLPEAMLEHIQRKTDEEWNRLQYKTRYI